VFAVIMAGGQGTRFWPRSRRSKPKQLLEIVGKRTMIKKTIDRLSPLISEESIYAVINMLHLEETKEQTGLPEENIIVEPVGRNTAPCVGLAALHIERKDPEGIMIVLPADHHIEAEESFLETVLAAKEVASKDGYLVTLGIRPKSPSIGFGYIEKGELLGQVGSKEFFKVERFTEKPDMETARRFLSQGGFFWNSGMFIWKVSTILEEIRTHLPSLHSGLMEVREVIGTDQEREMVSRVYSNIEGVSIDYGIMEKSDIAVVIPSDFGWNDVGTWASLDEVQSRDEHGNVLKGKCLAVETRDTVVEGRDKLIVALGLERMIIVDTEDAILIADKDSSQDVKKIVKMLEEEGLDEYL